MTELSSIKIIEHRFHVNNDKGKSGIGYDMIIGHKLMAQLGPASDSKRQVLEWDGTIVHM